jgi:hypothetical protein
MAVHHPRTTTGQPPLRLEPKGFKEFARDLKWASSGLSGAEADLAMDAASDIAGKARQRAFSTGSQQARASRDLWAAGNMVIYGGKGYSMGAEFGAIRYPWFRPWRGNDSGAGYFLFPAVREVEQDLIDRADMSLGPIGRALRRAFPL